MAIRNSQKTAPANSGDKKSKTKSYRFMRFLFKWSFTLAIWGLVMLGGMTAFYAYDLPSTDKALEVTRRPAVTLLALDGSKMASLGDLQGQAVSVKDLPSYLPQAVIATEDRRFYDHSGIDFIGVARAMVTNLKAGRVVQGGSTISQQAAKNLFLTPDRTFKRKYQELLLAFWLEQKFTKDQILTIYLNRVYLGSGTYGVDAAARKYFSVPASKLTVFQAAIIAGLLKAPSRLNPRTNIKAAISRGKVVLSNMVAAGYLTATSAKRAARSNLRSTHNQRSQKIGRYFVDWISEQVRGFIGPQSGDVTVQTTLDAKLQARVEHHIEKYLSQNGKRYNVSEGAIIVMSPDGAVRAMAGGRNYQKSQFNRATQARRQPGSVFKPIVYLTALENGLSPDSRFTDSALTIKSWKPRNYDGKYHGEMSLKEALSRSVNTIAVKVSERVGRGNVVKTAKRLGITATLTTSPSLALGTSGVSLIEMTGAYAVLANGGHGIWPYGVERIKNFSGRELYRRQGGGTGRIVEPRHVKAMDDMLGEVIRTGTGKKARLRRWAAGKTGTSQSFRDAWFIGYTRSYVTGVWLGNDNDAPMNKITGGGLPAIIWQKIMSDAHGDKAVKNTGRATKPKPQAKEKSFWDKLIGSILSAD
ncbi:MAG: PBP1A family penicillin-binding protein [Rhodospirillaceae bacterium]|nr:PBP1A family penicillin-binding protein [Rhodospirillaceae bacterium]